MIDKNSANTIKFLYGEAGNSLGLGILNILYGEHPKKVATERLVGKNKNIDYHKLIKLMDYTEKDLVIPSWDKGEKVFNLSENGYNVLKQIHNIVS